MEIFFRLSIQKIPSQFLILFSGVHKQRSWVDVSVFWLVCFTFISTRRLSLPCSASQSEKLSEACRLVLCEGLGEGSGPRFQLSSRRPGPSGASPVGVCVGGVLLSAFALAILCLLLRLMLLLEQLGAPGHNFRASVSSQPSGASQTGNRFGEEGPSGVLTPTGERSAFLSVCPGSPL